MRLFLAEYACSGGQPGQILPESVVREGWAMLHALACDAVAAGQRDGSERLEVVCPVIEQWSARLPPTIDRRIVPSTGSHFEHWRRSSAGCDAALVIAPESDSILEKAFAAIGRSTPRWLGCAPPALALATDKWQTARALQRAGVSTPFTALLAAVGDRPVACDSPFVGPWIVKPRDGCGSVGLVRGHGIDPLDRLRAQYREDATRMIVQPFRDGLAASIAAICGPRAYHWLPAMQQSLLPEDCSYQGGCGPLPTALHARCQRLAETALRAIGPGVAGWVGCDLVLGQAADGTEDVLIEVNPRMTTSYIGLRHCVRSNLLSDLLDVATGQFERFTYADRVIRFTAAGDVLSEPRPAVPGLTT